MYGVAVADLGIAPSEVRKMTPHEIMAVVEAKTRHNKQNGLGEADLDELYNDYLEARGECD
jgi:hypothetical protein